MCPGQFSGIGCRYLIIGQSWLPDDDGDDHKGGIGPIEVTKDLMHHLPKDQKFDEDNTYYLVFKLNKDTLSNLQVNHHPPVGGEHHHDESHHHKEGHHGEQSGHKEHQNHGNGESHHKKREHENYDKPEPRFPFRGELLKTLSLSKCNNQ